MGAGVVLKILGMFDKVDDIIYEPIHLVCDVLRQPLKQIDVHNDKNKAEHEQILTMQLKRFEADLEQDKKRREMELSIEQRKLNNEIDQMILDADMARGEAMVQLELKYRKEMAEAAVQLGQIIANITVEARSKLLTLYTEKEKEYLDLQSKYRMDMFETVRQLKEVFPDGSGDDIIHAEIERQLEMITGRSVAFSKLMNKDMENVFGIIDKSVQDVTGLAAKYFQPAQTGQPALTQGVINQAKIE